MFDTAQKMKFSIKNFLSKCDQIRSFLRIWLHLLKKSLMGNFIFCVMWDGSEYASARPTRENDHWTFGELSIALTHEVPVLHSYRNQSIDLLCKTIDWFLYEGNTGT